MQKCFQETNERAISVIYMSGGYNMAVCCLPAFWTIHFFGMMTSINRNNKNRIIKRKKPHSLWMWTNFGLNSFETDLGIIVTVLCLTEW